MANVTGVKTISLATWAALAAGAAYATVAGCSSNATLTAADASASDAASSDVSVIDSAVASEASSMDQSSSCPSGLTSCSASCVNTTNDPGNCGACGKTCSGGLVCSAGACALSCAGGTTQCGSLCIDKNVDPANCGGCGHACGSLQLCSSGACVSSCPQGEVACGGSCVDPGTSNQYCGATGGCGVDGGTAGMSCPSGQVCSGGSCSLTCQTGLVECDGTCINPTTSNQYCGATGGCSTDAGTSGTVCPSGEVCSGGTCSVSCQAGLVECGGTCIDPTTNPQYCGATSGCDADAGSAGTVCGAGTACTVGDGGTPTCQPTCAPPLIVCSGACVDPRNDPNNCNGCGNACGVMQYCSSSTCACATPTLPVTGPAGLQCVPSGMIRWYPFDGDTNDYSGSGQNLTNSGATPSANRNSTPATAYAFDGSTSYMQAAGTGIPLGNGARTFTAWVQPTASVITQGTSVGSFITTGQGNCSALMFGMSRTVPLSGTPTDLYFWGGCDDQDSNIVFPINTWSFAAIVWDGTNITQYLGAQSATAALAATLATPASNLFVGIETSTNLPTNAEFHFTGSIDDIRIFNRALSAAEIAEVQSLP